MFARGILFQGIKIQMAFPSKAPNTPPPWSFRAAALGFESSSVSKFKAILWLKVVFPSSGARTPPDGEERERHARFSLCDQTASVTAAGF